MYLCTGELITSYVCSDYFLIKQNYHRFFVLTTGQICIDWNGVIVSNTVKHILDSMEKVYSIFF